MKKIVMPKMPDFSKMSLHHKISTKCEAVKRVQKCPDFGCKACALWNTNSYKTWKSQQPKTELVKWPISNKDLFFILPRLFINSMSNRWKKSFQKLLFEFYNTNGFPGSLKGGKLKLRVSATKNGKYTKIPDEFKNFDK